VTATDCRDRAGPALPVPSGGTIELCPLSPAPEETASVTAVFEADPPAAAGPVVALLAAEAFWGCGSVVEAAV
jgi:hypothetical protein